MINLKLVNPSKLKIKSEFIHQEEYETQQFKSMLFGLAKLTQDLYATGIAACQVGWSKRIIMLGAHDGSRYDVFLNPSYKPIKKQGKFTSFESSLNFGNRLYRVERWKMIKVSWNEIVNNKWKQKIKKFKGYSSSNLQQLIDSTNGITIEDKGEFEKIFEFDFEINQEKKKRYNL